MLNSARFFFLFIISLIASFSAYSQKIDTLIFKYKPPDTVRYWKFSGNVGLNFQLVGLREWSRGGKPSMALASNFNMIARYEKDVHLWENKLDAGLGLIREEEENTENRILRKNDDFLIFISKYSRNLVKTWYLTGMIDFRSQFANGYATARNADDVYPLVSKFMSPGILTPSLGVSYKKDKFSFTLSPVSGRLVFVLEDSLTRIPANGTEPGKTFNSLAGTTITISDERNIMDNVFWRFNLVLFTPFSDYRPKNTDINGELYIRFKVNKYISSNFNLRMIYDDNYDPNGTGKYPLQLNYVLNVGLTYDIWQN